jgi:RNA polymerase sigma factor (sigma-70 family)
MTEKEYKACVDLYADKIYRFILKNMKDEYEAQNVVQDSFEKLWMKVGQVKAETARAYLFTTAYRCMIDVIRKNKRHVYLEEGMNEMPVSTGTYTDVKEVLDKALAGLPLVQKSVILLRDYEGYSYEEIGSIMQLNLPQVKTYIFRARVYLKNYIGKMELVL